MSHVVFGFLPFSYTNPSLLTIVWVYCGAPLGRGQVLPVDFTITGKLSSGEVTWEPAVVDFGNCYTTQVRVCIALRMHARYSLTARCRVWERLICPSTSPCVWFRVLWPIQSASASLAITNHSDLPQKFAFVGLPVEVTVVPNEGFGTLLPKETVHVTLQFSPTSATGACMGLTLSPTIPLSSCSSDHFLL